MNRHNLPLAWHAATDMSAIGWVMIANSSDCLISPGWLASIAEGDSIINATLLLYEFIYYNCMSVEHLISSPLLPVDKHHVQLSWFWSYSLSEGLLCLLHD